MESNALVEAIENTANTAPYAVAFTSNGQTTSYEDLSKASNSIASQLIGMAHDRHPIVVFGHKDFLMVAGFIACLKTGHAYVPVDVELPASRIGDIVSQLEDPFVIAAAPLSDALGPYIATNRVLDISRYDSVGALIDGLGEGELPAKEGWVHGEETQYIIFTSGSTGKPKGIEVTANDVAHFAEWVQGFPVVCEGGCVFLDQPPYSFDLSEYEVVGALTTGGSLHAVSHELTSDTRSLFEDLRSSGMRVWVSTPSFADLCLVDPTFGQELLPDVRLFLFCGEALRHSTAQALRERFPKAIVANTYGPTESTVAVTYCEIGAAELADEAALPAGVARKGTEIRICDPESGSAMPQGQTGEIVIVGNTVAKGYYRNPEKTAKSFFEAELSSGERVRGYHTGDLGHLDERGVLHCEGRMDSLVKLHGFRIELEDVEENIRALRGVKQACVVPVSHQGSIAYLKAFVVLEQHPDGTPAYEEVEGESRACDDLGGIAVPSRLELERALKTALGKRIPEYMVPRRFAVRESMPLTPNGKIDRKALAALGHAKRA